MLSCFGEFGKADGGIDVIPQNGLPGVDVSTNETLDTGAQRLSPERHIPANAHLHGWFEITR
jgi:hypothetical protein